MGDLERNIVLTLPNPAINNDGIKESQEISKIGSISDQNPLSNQDLQAPIIERAEIGVQFDGIFDANQIK